MNLSKDTCHVCLDEMTYITKRNQSRCENESCSGFICNTCWNNLIVEDIETCPLCRGDLTRAIYLEPELSLSNGVKASLRKRTINVMVNAFFGIMGFIIVLIFYYIKSGSVGGAVTDVNDLNNYEFYGILLVSPIIGLLFTICLALTCSCLGRGHYPEEQARQSEQSGEEEEEEEEEE